MQMTWNYDVSGMNKNFFSNLGTDGKKITLKSLV